MQYDRTFFDAPVDRLGTACEKWDGLWRKENKELLPMWVADMDFRGPGEVMRALQKRAAHGIYGYTEQTGAAARAMLDFFQRRHGLSLALSQQRMLPCVVTGLQAAVRALTKPGDGVILQPPVYGPFFNAVESNGRIPAENPLLLDSRGCYTMDYDGLRRLCQKSAKLMFLCNPHNPVGRCWTRDELLRLWNILSYYGVTLVSDEIHWDFVYERDAFTSALALEPETSDSNEGPGVVVLTSASKTFNLAGLQQAAALSRNAVLLDTLDMEMKRAGVVSGNIFGMVATEAAYRHGDAWLDALLPYLLEAYALCGQMLSVHLPKAVLSPLEATYLGWIDLRAYGFSTAELMARTHEAGVAFTPGTFFGKSEGEGFLRINLACPHSQTAEALKRLERAVTS